MADAEGFVAVADLLNRNELREYNESQVEKCAQTSFIEPNRPRFTAVRREDGRLYVRANWGHSSMPIGELITVIVVIDQLCR